MTNDVQPLLDVVLCDVTGQMEDMCEHGTCYWCCLPCSRKWAREQFAAMDRRKESQ